MKKSQLLFYPLFWIAQSSLSSEGVALSLVVHIHQSDTKHGGPRGEGGCSGHSGLGLGLPRRETMHAWIRPAPKLRSWVW
ncbi:hypothetical protein BD324DRAFT_624866 [Kockovaella imperatae]|uniref:Secreted protein n=1 Tax=Kockovaella imperatae TaxID=4999 RepID=A0A1Y1UHV6_9TREE|nr:hypothetical protein BD324DRAFT_624866 [Kockovaella imperatae]ORX37117.1 hypothetical protein BD324DRAFT_624866 [Kockovaella imperatae]